ERRPPTSSFWSSAILSGRPAHAAKASSPRVASNGASRESRLELAWESGGEPGALERKSAHELARTLWNVGGDRRNEATFQESRRDGRRLLVSASVARNGSATGSSDPSAARQPGTRR